MPWQRLTLPFSLLLVASALATTIPRASADARKPTAVAGASVDAVGAIFTITAAGTLGRHFCTGTVIDSKAGDVVLTAAHCLKGRQPGTLAFVPGYRNGSTPLGIWTIGKTFVDRTWASSHDPDDDFAFLLVSQPGRRSTLEARTGGERLSTSGSAGQLTTVVGYPAATDQAISCRSTLLEFSPTQLEFDCDGYTNGTSGSALVVDADPDTGLGVVVGAIGGYEEGGLTASVSYAAAFSTTTEALYRQAAQAG
jgi:V8-like Glu-specific endopeptidase